MKIAFLTSEYPHEKTTHSAGIGSSIKNLAQALVKAGHQITIFVYAQKLNEIFNENEVSIHLIENKHYIFGKWYFYRKYIQNYCNKVINEQHINIIEAPDWTGITAFMKFKCPLLIRLHGTDAYFCHLEGRKQKLKNYFFEKIAINSAKAYVAPTIYAGKISQKLFNIKKNKTIKTIHNGLELDKFEKLPFNEYEDGLILYFGTIIRKKGVLELPEIFKQVVTKYTMAHLVIIGSDSNDIITNSPSTWSLLEDQLSDELIQKVTYVGKVPYEEVQSYIKKAHVCVFPTFAETLGMVTIESMAMQKAVVNSNIGWAQELIIDGESGFLVHPTNHKEYALKIVELLKNDKLRMSIGVKARERVEMVFDIDKISAENIQFYKSLIE